MPEAAEPPAPAQPVRTWRPMILWTAGILAILGLAWLGARALRLYRTHRIVVGSMSTGLDAPGPVIEALGGRERAVIRLAEYAKLPPRLLEDGEARMFAFLYLAQCGPNGLRVVLAAVDDDEGYTNTEARKAMIFICSAGASSAAVLGDLARLLCDRSTRIRLRAAEALSQCPSLPHAVLPDLLAAASDRNPHVRRDVATAIGRVPDAAEAVPALTTMLSDPDPEVRAAAAGALKQIRSEEPQP